MPVNKKAPQTTLAKAISRAGRQPRQRKGQERRQQILDASKLLLVKGGLEKLALREVADQLGITHGNLQYYFPTKHALLVGIFDQELGKYTEGLVQAVASTSSRRGRLAAIIDSALTNLKAPETALWRMLASMADHSAEMQGILRNANHRYQQVVASELKQIAPQLSAQRRQHIAQFIHAIVDGLSIQFAYEDPDSANMRALESEIKVAIADMVEID
jgi:AcrR family transcriptional regulator